MANEQKGKKVSASFGTGVVALVFLAVGYQTALFVHRAAVVGIAANRDAPDTVYVVESQVFDDGGAIAGGGGSGGASHQRQVRRSGAKSRTAQAVRRSTAKRSFESFPFDPNTASVEDLMRLGFTQRQAESIDNYRRKGGRFRRKEDFAKSYVVADSVYERLEPFIDIPKVDINAADSAAFDALPGIGPWFAAKMVSYRKELHGYSFPEQLMDIYRFDQERFDALKDLITVGPCAPYPLWSLPEDSLKLHPYIRSRAHGVVLFRSNNPPEACTVDALATAGVLPPDAAAKLASCRIIPPITQ